MTYTRLNPDYSSDINALKDHVLMEGDGHIGFGSNGNIHIISSLNSNNKWFDVSFEATGIWMRVYTGSGNSNPDGAWKKIASWT